MEDSLLKEGLAKLKAWNLCGAMRDGKGDCDTCEEQLRSFVSRVRENERNKLINTFREKPIAN